MSTEHSMWLMPSGDVRQDLQDLISQLSTEYSAPLFPPHVTLIGKLDAKEAVLVSQARQLAVQLKPYELQLGKVDYLEDFYRSLFVHIQETEPVLKANQSARRVFDRQSDPPYMPHMSLLYGNFTPELKERIIAKIGRRLDGRFQATSCYLYSTEGDTKGWYCVGEFPLGEPGK